MTEPKLYTYQGQTKTAKQWSQATGIRYGTLWSRLKRGLTIEAALTTPLREWSVLYYHDGQCRTLKEWAQSSGIRYGTLCERLRHGWDWDRAFAPSESESQAPEPEPAGICWLDDSDEVGAHRTT